MSIQQNINQTLSLASYIGTQIKMANSAKKAAGEAAEKAEFQEKRTAAQRKYEETSTALLEHRNIEKLNKEWHQEKERGIKEGTITKGPEGKYPEYYQRVPKHLEMGDKYKAELLKRTKAHLASAEEYSTYGPNLVKPEEMAELRGYIMAEEAKIAITEAEKAQKKAMSEKDGKQRIEKARLEPKGISAEVVKSRLWKREDNK